MKVGGSSFGKLNCLEVEELTGDGVMIGVYVREYVGEYTIEYVGDRGICFSTSEFFVHKALMSFPNGSSAGLDGISPQTLKDSTAKSNGQTGLYFLRALTNLVDVILEGKVPFEHRPYFLGAKLIALKKPDGGLRPIAVGNTFRQLSAKCAGYHVFESRQTRYGNRQIGVGTKRGAELASHNFRSLIESPQPKENVILKIDFENAFNSINLQFMLEKVFEKDLTYKSIWQIGLNFLRALKML